MNSILNNLNLGLSDLLAVLLPGMILFSLIPESYIPMDLVALKDQENNSILNPILFISSSYFIGYVIYVISSPLDNWYDRIKRFGLGLDMKGKNVSILNRLLTPCRAFVRFLFPHLRDTHDFILEIVKLKNLEIGSKYDGNKHQMINAYHYAYKRLMIEDDRMFLETERYMSTARFFRSMAVVWALSLMMSFYNCEGRTQTLLFIALILISLLVFMNRWRKAHHVAFKNLIILEGKHKRNVISPNP